MRLRFSTALLKTEQVSKNIGDYYLFGNTKFANQPTISLLRATIFTVLEI